MEPPIKNLVRATLGGAHKLLMKNTPYTRFTSLIKNGLTFDQQKYVNSYISKQQNVLYCGHSFIPARSLLHLIRSAKYLPYFSLHKTHFFSPKKWGEKCVRLMERMHSLPPGSSDNLADPGGLQFTSLPCQSSEERPGAGGVTSSCRLYRAVNKGSGRAAGERGKGELIFLIFFI